MPSAVIAFSLLAAAVRLYGDTRLRLEDPVLESVIERFSVEANRPPREPLINIQQERQVPVLDDAADLRHRAVHHLSFGEQKRVAMAGVLAMNPAILILDEPTSGLDPAGEELMMHLLNRLNRRQGITVMLVTR
jgi:ABC-type glutathione transport system ATPase component